MPGCRQFLVNLMLPKAFTLNPIQKRGERSAAVATVVAWDVLHRTLRLDVPQERVVIGVPAYETAAEVTIGKMLLLPFRRQREDWLPSVPSTLR